MSLPNWLSERRDAARATVASQPPTARIEANKYTSFRALSAMEPAELAVSISGFEISDLGQLLAWAPARVEALLGSAQMPWAQAGLAADHGLTALRLGSGSGRIRLRGETSGVAHHRILLLTEPGAESHLHIELSGATGHHLNTVVELGLAPGSHLTLSAGQSLDAAGFATTAWQASLGEKARLDLTLVDTGAAISRHDIEVALDGPEAEAHLAGLMCPRAGQHHDHHLNLRHNAPDTTSDQLFKGLVAPKGRAVFTGCVHVAAGATGCSADQLSRGLLLGDGAEFDSRPQLKVFIDAVSASHGSSIGALDPAALFFLRSRGLDPDDARRLLAEGFAGEVVERLRDEAAHRLAREAVAAAVTAGSA